MKLRTAFYLTGTAKSGNKVILTKIFSGSSLILSASTGLRVRPSDWNKQRQAVKTTDPLADDKNSFLDSIRSKVIKVSMDDTLQGTSELIRILEAELNLSTAHNGAGFLKAFSECLEDKQKRLQPSSLKHYFALPEKLLAYEQKIGKELSFNFWNPITMQDFYDFLTNELHLLNDTATTVIKTLKSFLNWGLSRSMHRNDRYKGFAVRWEYHSPLILTPNEIQALQLLPPQSEALEKTRDLFLFSVYTLQRHSDIKQFHTSQLSSDGHSWKVYQQKTRRHVTVPLSAQAKDILERRALSLPEMSQQKLNKHLKRLAELAGITQEVERVSFSGKRRIVTRERKCDLISTHTARRTGVTLLIQAGAPLPLIQKLTGHSKITTLLKYDNSSIDGMIEFLNNMP